LSILILTACGENSPAPSDINELDKVSNEFSSDTVLSEDEGNETFAMDWPSFDWDNKHQDYLYWNEVTYEAITDLGSSLISRRPSDINSFCPNYSDLNVDEKTMFWISLLAAMTRYESFYDPDVFFQEGFNDSQGRPIISRGLLQLSVESARGYGCPIPQAEDLHDPKINLECGVKILDRWVGRDGLISGKVSGRWRGGARYWAVLRRASILAKIKAKTSSFEYCQ